MTPRTVATRVPALGVAATLLLAPMLAGCGSTKAAKGDVAITTCTADASGGRPTATGTVINHSSKASTYVLDINFLDTTGNKVSEGGASLGKVEPSATATFHATGLSSANGPLTCKLATVKRTVAP